MSVGLMYDIAIMLLSSSKRSSSAAAPKFIGPLSFSRPKIIWNHVQLQSLCGHGGLLTAELVSGIKRVNYWKGVRIHLLHVVQINDSKVVSSFCPGNLMYALIAGFVNLMFNRADDTIEKSVCGPPFVARKFSSDTRFRTMVRPGMCWL